MTQYERMLKGLIYDPQDPQIAAMQAPYLEKLAEFNSLKTTDYDRKYQYMKEVFAEVGENCYIELPFHANWGGKNVHLGNTFYANFNLTLVDDGDIYIGNNVKFGPNVTITTATHPVNARLRRRGLQYNRDVHIGDNVWIGEGVIILPGVSIGENSVIGAGAVVTRDIPANVVAVGNPCRVMREISSHDDEYFYRDEKIDWENL